MKDVMSIELVFENVDSAVIERKDIGFFLMDDVRTSVSRVAINSIARYETAHVIVMELFASANKSHYEFGMLDFPPQLLFDRLKGNDITSVELNYADGSKDVFYTDYDGEATNANQSWYLSATGDLFIVIAKDKSVGDYFKQSEIDDKKFQDAKKSCFC